MNNFDLSEDAKAILLLCAYFDNNDRSEPLKLTEYNQLVAWLVDAKKSPADLLQMDDVKEPAHATQLNPERLSILLNRGVQLGFAVEKWNNYGIWIICRSDKDYPKRYRKHLAKKAPPILFCSGDKSLLKGGGMAIVGSRNVDSLGEDFTRDVAINCAHNGFPVISGGARGVDQIAMKTCLDAGGHVVGILAENLLKKSVGKDVRYAIADGRLLLCSPYHPEARFSVGTAMGRNKLIYAMADYGVVVSSDYNKGGTWAGAQEELRRENHRPVFVRLQDNIPKGNRELIKKGALSFPDFSPDQNLGELLDKLANDHISHPVQDDFLDTPLDLAVKENSMQQPEEVKGIPALAPQTAYDLVKGLIVSLLEREMSSADLAAKLDVKKAQMDEWLKKAVKEKLLDKKSKPVRYCRHEGDFWSE
jgi:predicted Rossmann fold nucleotide-binding protein DprA/Smf involved in DNA uptake